MRQRTVEEKLSGWIVSLVAAFSRGGVSEGRGTHAFSAKGPGAYPAPKKK